MFTHRFSVILGSTLIYYGISEAIILFIRTFCYLLANYRLYSTAHSNLKLLMTLQTPNNNKKKWVPTCCFSSCKFGIVRINSCTPQLWSKSLGRPMRCEFRKVTDMAPYCIDPNSWMAAGVMRRRRGGRVGSLPPPPSRLPSAPTTLEGRNIS